MKINSYTRGNVVILEPVGRLLPGQVVGELDEKLYALLGRGQFRVIIDLGKTSRIGSWGISVLLRHHIKFKEIGGNLKLVNLTKNIQQIIAITRLSLVFEVFDSLEGALDSFNNLLPTHEESELKKAVGDS
jgi:anti-anti-sigma factor